IHRQNVKRPKGVSQGISIVWKQNGKRIKGALPAGRRKTVNPQHLKLDTFSRETGKSINPT
ncbi:TPA: hypothetical protein ACG5N9_004505, partial [Klebsiella pneumoniae]